MEFKDIILKRKSVRKYKDKQIKSWIVKEILDSARFAPSAGNAQNWRFIVVKHPDVKKAIAGAALKQWWMTTAPVFIVVCSDNAKLKAIYKKKGEKYIIENCAIAATYIMLKAVEYELGTCWVGSFDKEKVKDILGLDKNMSAEVIITLGYPEKGELIRPHKRHGLDRLVFFEKYLNRSEKPPQRLADYVKKGVKKLKKLKKSK